MSSHITEPVMFGTAIEENRPIEGNTPEHPHFIHHIPLFQEAERGLSSYLWTLLDYTLVPVVQPLRTIQHVWFTFLNRNKPLPPSALGNGLFGNLEEFKNAENRLELLESYFITHQQDGYCAARVGPFHNFYLIGNPEIADHLLSRENAANYPRGNSLSAWRLFSPNGLSEGLETRLARKEAMEMITPLRLPELFDPMMHTVNELVSLWQTEANNNNLIDVGEWCARFTLVGQGIELFHTDLFNLSDPDCQERSLSTIRGMDRVFSSLIEIMINPFAGSEIKQELEEGKQELFQALHPVVTAVLQNAVTSGKGNHIVLQKVAGLTSEDEVSEELVLDTLEEFVGFLQAAFETTATALTWTLYELALHPEVQERLANELPGHAPAITGDLEQVPYLSKVMEESLRLHPPIPMTVRDNGAPSTFPYFQTKAGSVFVIAPQFIHHYAWPNGTAFDPDRFTDEMLTDQWQRRNAEYSPFIRGPHACPGRYFAKQKMQLFLWEVIRNFKISFSEETTLPVRGEIKITAKPEQKIFVKLEPRL